MWSVDLRGKVAPAPLTVSPSTTADACVPVLVNAPGSTMRYISTVHRVGPHTTLVPTMVLGR
eukprot:1468673-Rhodomonas_salina.1